MPGAREKANELAARSICSSKGLDPDALAVNMHPFKVNDGLFIVPKQEYQRPLWTFFIADAEAALTSVRAMAGDA